MRRSMIVAACLAAIAPLAGCSQAAPAPATGVEASSPELAADLVERFDMGFGLELLASQAMRNSSTFAELERKLGAAEAERRVRQALTRTIPPYQERWDRSLAIVYARHFTPEQLRSLAELGPQSPHAAAFNAKREAVGDDMRALASVMLQELVAEATSNAAEG